MKQVTIPALLLLAACGGGGGSDSAEAPNGLNFATASSELSDVEGAGEIQIQVVRTLTDYDSGVTQLVTSDETVTVESFDGAAQDVFTITLDGETFVVGGTDATENANGEEWNSDFQTSGDVSAAISIFSYAGAADPDLTGEFDSEAVFVVGFETNPDEIEALAETSTGGVDYNGDFRGFGQVLGADGSLIESQVGIEGDIAITASFNDGAVEGSLTASNSDIPFDTEFSTNIEGNEFAGDLTCTSGCTDNASSIAGTFFGEDALETSGAIGFDVQTTSDGQFVGAAGFTAVQQ